MDILSIVCLYCYVLYFDCEKLKISCYNHFKFSICCFQEQIQLPFLQAFTRVLQNYLTEDDYYSKNSHNNIKQYNVIFAITLVEVKINNFITKQSGPYCFKTQSTLHYLTSTLLPYGDYTFTYIQIYILDIAEQLSVKRDNNCNLDPMVIEDLQIMLLNSHSYIDHYCHTYKLIRKKLIEEQEKITIRLYVNLQQDQRTYNLSIAKEIAAIIPEEKIYHIINNRNVVLQTRGGQLPRISQNSLSYTVLYYVLLFPKSKNDWHSRISICGA